MPDRHPTAPVPRAGISAAIFSEGELLLIKRAKPPYAGLWSMPGGHIKPGEEAAAAARREVLEEAGIEVTLCGVCGVADVIVRGESGLLVAHHVLVVFAGRAGSRMLRAGSDASDAGWFGLGALPDMELVPGIIGHAQRALAFLEAARL